MKDRADCFPLKVVQSDGESSPRAEAEAVGRLKEMVEPEPVMVKSVPVVVVERVIFPAEVWLVGPIESTPMFVTLPFAYERPEEKVVVACHVGTPPTKARICPLTPADVVERALVPLPRRMEFGWIVERPVPPPATDRVPERDGVKERVLPLPVTVRADVRPFVEDVEVAMVMAGPVWDWFTGPIEVRAEVR